MTYEEVLRAVALGDVELDGATWASLVSSVAQADARLEAAARLGALVALGASETSMVVAVDSGIGAGLTCDQIVAVLLDVAPLVGTARTVAAAPALASALGVDVEALLDAPPGSHVTE